MFERRRKKESVLGEILRHVEKPGRYTGGEWNAIRKPLRQVEVKVALAFPDLYEIGMSYIGQKILYFILNARPEISAERVFAPWPDMERELRARRVPLFSLENRIPLREFDIVGFSLLYELNYSNVLTMLDLGGIPLFSRDRGRDDPLVVAGGPAAFNPEPLAEFFDMFLLGDGEEAFPEIIRVFRTWKKEDGRDREKLLERMASVQGVYVPSFYAPYSPGGSPLLAVKPVGPVPARIKKRLLLRFAEAPFPEEVVVPNIQVVFDRVAVEAARGCPQNCRFCQAASIYFPHRPKRPSAVVSNAVRSILSTGYEDLSLTALSVSDYPYLEKVMASLMAALGGRHVSLSLPSLRPGGLTTMMMEEILRVRKTGFTLVPEAGTERLRRVINKNLTEEEIHAAVENAFSRGWNLIKLYFMIGLPTETEEDLEGIGELVKDIVAAGRKILGHTPKIHLSVNGFIPKPHTPFQWMPMDTEARLKEKYGFLLARIKRYPSVRLKRNAPAQSALEAVFSRGDRILTRVLHRAWRKGARFDGWSDTFRNSLWEEAFSEEGVDPAVYLGRLDPEVKLPWDHVDTGIKKSLLRREWDRALRGEPSPPCGDRDCGECRGCRFPVSPGESMDTDVSPPGSLPAYIGERTEKTHRYRASYSKTGEARFLSHRDLCSILQQGMRRACVPVAYSRGFHPKMHVSYSPALPLGMEGKEEWLEFKSCYLIPIDAFLSGVNQKLPKGIVFHALSRLEEEAPSFHKAIRAFVYSLDLGDRSIRMAVEKLVPGITHEEDYYRAVQSLVDAFIEKTGEAGMGAVSVDRCRGRFFFTLYPKDGKSLRPQEVAERIFGIRDAVFAMTREAVRFAGD